MISETSKTQLLKLARQAIKSRLENKPINIPENIKQKYSKKQASFVTLTINNELRGCIGSLLPTKPLYQDIIENAENAAFNDPRFPSLTKSELPKIKIELSLLTIPKPINYKDSKNLLEKIKNKGVIIKSGFNQATYLPQVWEQLPSPEQFLSSLCIKSGLPADFWKLNKKLIIQTYEVEKIKED